MTLPTTFVQNKVKRTLKASRWKMGCTQIGCMIGLCLAVGLYHGSLCLARRLGLAGGHVCGLAKTSWSYQMLGFASWASHDILGTLDNRYLKDIFYL